MRTFIRSISGVPPFGRLLCVVALLGLVASSRTEACSCIQPGPPAEEFTRADAVFVGRVTRIEPSPVSDPFETLLVTLHLERGFRGELQENTVVATASSSAACGFGFVEGEVYVVYAEKRDGMLHASLCSRTADIRHASEDLRFLDSQPTLPTLSGSGTGVLDIGKQAVRMGLSGGLGFLVSGS